jgi:hypothetical protein
MCCSLTWLVTRSCIKKPHRGIEPEVRFFDLIGLISLRSTLLEIEARLPTVVTAFVWVLALVCVCTAFGIFSRCQVTDFDLLGLFLLRHFIFLSYWVVLCGSHRRTIDARL